MKDPENSGWFGRVQAKLRIKKLSMAKIGELKKKIKEELQNWEREMFHFVCAIARNLIQRNS